MVFPHRVFFAAWLALQCSAGLLAQTGQNLPTHGAVTHLDTGDVAFFAASVAVFSIDDNLASPCPWSIEVEFCNAGGFAQSIPIRIRRRLPGGGFATLTAGTLSLPANTCAYFHLHIPDPYGETAGGSARMTWNPPGGFPQPLVVEASIAEDPPLRGMCPDGGTRLPPPNVYQPGTEGTDIWVLDIEQARFARVGNGCQGSAGVPDLDLGSGRLPRIGDSYDLALTNLPANTLALGLFGIVKLPAPLDLGAFGAPGCVLHPDPIATVPLAVQNGAALWVTAVPGSAALVGLPLCQQGFAVDPPANNLGVILSNAVQATVGN